MKVYLIPVSLLFSFAAYSQKTTIQLNLSTGQTYRQVQESEMKINQTINGQEQATVITISGQTKFTVTAAHDSVYDMEVAYERLGVKISNGQGQSIVNSDNNSTDMMGSMFRSMVNTPFNLVMTKWGRILKVNSDTIFATAMNKMVDVPEEQRNQLKEQMKQSFGEKAFKSSYEMYTAIYPNHPVRQGDQWPVTGSFSATVPLEINGIYSLVGTTDTSFQLHGKASTVSKSSDKPTMLNGLPVMYDLAGEMISDLDINKKTGWIYDVKLSQAVKGKMKVLDCDQVPGGMEVPMSVNSKTTVTDKQ